MFANPILDVFLLTWMFRSGCVLSTKRGGRPTQQKVGASNVDTGLIRMMVSSVEVYVQFELCVFERKTLHIIYKFQSKGTEDVHFDSKNVLIFLS